MQAANISNLLPKGIRRAHSQSFNRPRLSEAELDLQRELLIQSDAQEKEIARLRIIVASKNEESSYWQKKYHEFREKHSKELDALQEQLAEEHLASFRKDVLLNDVASTSIRFESQLEMNKNFTRDLEARVEELRDAEFRIHDEDVIRASEVRELEDENASLLDQIDALEKCLANTNEAYDAMSQNYHDTRDAYHVATQQVSLLRGENRKLSEQLNKLRARRRSTELSGIWDAGMGGSAGSNGLLRVRSMTSHGDMDPSSRRALSVNLMEQVDTQNDIIDDLQQRLDDAAEILERALGQMEVMIQSKTPIIDSDDLYQTCFEIRKLLGVPDLPPLPFRHQEYSGNLLDALRSAEEEDQSDTESFDPSRLTFTPQQFSRAETATPVPLVDISSMTPISMLEPELPRNGLILTRQRRERAAVLAFFEQHSQASTWRVWSEDHRYYSLQFDGGAVVNARIAFLFCVVTLIGHVVGLRRRTFSYGMLLLLRSRESKLEWLVNIFQSIHTALQFHNDEKIYSFMYALLNTLFQHHNNVSEFFKSAADYNGGVAAPDDPVEPEAAQATGFFGRLSRRSVHQHQVDSVPEEERVPEDVGVDRDEGPTTI